MNGRHPTQDLQGPRRKAWCRGFAGIDGPRAPFRVVALIHPSRLVIDVVDDSVKPERDSTETLSPRTHKPSSWPIDVSYLAQTVRIQGHSAADDRQAVNVCTNIGNVHIHAWIDRVGIAREQRQGAGVVQGRGYRARNAPRAPTPPRPLGYRTRDAG